MRVISALRRSPWVPVSLAVVYVGVAWTLLPDAMWLATWESSAHIVDSSDWLARIFQNIWLVLDLMIGVVVGVVTAMAIRALATVEESRAASLRLLLWLMLLFVFLLPSAEPRPAAATAALLWSAVVLAIATLLALGQVAYRRRSHSAHTPVNAEFSAPGA
jgi:hypothetical protein